MAAAQLQIEARERKAEVKDVLNEQLAVLESRHKLCDPVQRRDLDQERLAQRFVMRALGMCLEPFEALERTSSCSAMLGCGVRYICPDDFVAAGNERPDHAAMQRTLEAVLSTDGRPSWADPLSGRTATSAVCGVQQLLERGYSPALTLAAVAVSRRNACASDCERALRLASDKRVGGHSEDACAARRLVGALDPFGASDWWLGYDPKASTERVYGLTTAERVQCERDYYERCWRLIAFYIRHCVPRGGAPVPYPQPWAAGGLPVVARRLVLRRALLH